MNHRFLGVAIATASAMALLSRGPCGRADATRGAKSQYGRGCEELDASAHALGRTRPAGHVLEQDHYAVRAAGEC